MKFRAYLIGFEPPGWQSDVAVAKKLMIESDFAALAPGGLPLGQRISTATLSAGVNGATPPSGSTLVCIGHEHGGKIALLSDEAENAA